MNDNDESECCDTSSTRRENTFLPLHVESPGEPAYGGDTLTKSASLSPVLLSPGSTTKKLIASGKIKNCVILLRKASLTQSYVKAFPDTGEGALDAEMVSGQTELPHTGAICTVHHFECYKGTGLEATSLRDHDVREDEPDTTRSEGDTDRFTASSRNVFTSFFHEWPVVKREGNINIESSQMDDTSSITEEEYVTPEQLSKCSEEASQSVSSTYAVDIATDSKRLGNARFLSDDVMSISSTGSSETIEYPICSEKDTLDEFEITGDDEQETHHERDAEDEVYEVCNEPPRLERLESLPVPGYCLDDPPVLSPRLLRVVDYTRTERKEPSPVTVSDASQNAKPPNNDASVGVKIPELHVVSTTGSTEINESKSSQSPIESRQSDPGQKDSTTIAFEVLPVGTKEQNESNEDPPRTHSTNSVQAEQRQNELKSVINDVFFSQSSFTETAFSNVETSLKTLRDSANTPIAQEDQCVQAEYQDILRQIADTNNDTAEYEGSANPENMYSGDIPVCGSAEDLQITEVVSIGVITSTKEQELSKEPVDSADIAPDVPNISVTKDQTEFETVDQSSFTYQSNHSHCAEYVGWNNPPHEEASASSAVSTSKHSSLPDINSQTEIERAIASITDSQQSRADGAQDGQENTFDGSIEVAEVVINPHDHKLHHSTNEVGIMFSLDRRTPSDDEKGEIQSQNQISFNGQHNDNQAKGNDATNTPAIQSNPDDKFKGITLPTIEKRHRSPVSNSPPKLNLEQNFLLSLHAMSSEPIPVEKQTVNDGLSPINQEVSQSKRFPYEKQDHSSCNPDHVIQIRNSDSNSIETIPPTQDMTTHISNRMQNWSNDETNISRGADNDEFPQLRSKEMDTAISLTLLSKMTAAIKSQEQNSASNLTTETNPPPSLLLPVHQDKSRQGEARTRHQSAPRIPDIMRQEENHESDSFTQRRPNSTHGVTTQGVETSTKVRSNLQQANVRNIRGRTRYPSTFTFVDYSNPAPPGTGQFDELKMRLMQKQRLRSEHEQQRNTSQQTQPQCLPDCASALLEKDLNNPKSQHDTTRLHAGVPVEFPDGKRFMAYNTEALNYPQINCNSNQANGHTAIQIQNTLSSVFSSSNQTVSQQVQTNSTQNDQITKGGYNTHHQQVRSINTHPNSSCTTPLQVPHNLQTPRTDTNALTGGYTGHERQPQAIQSHQSPSLGSPVHSMSPHLPQRVAYLPEQVNPTHGVASSLGTGSCQEPVLSSAYSIPGGYGKTEVLHIIRNRQPTDPFPHNVPDEPNVTVAQSTRQYYTAEKSSGQGQIRLAALTENIGQYQNLQGSFQPQGDCTEAAIDRRQATAANRRAFEFSRDLSQEQPFIMAAHSAGVPNVREEREPGRDVNTAAPAYIGRVAATEIAMNPTPALSVAPVYQYQRDNDASGCSFVTLTRPNQIAKHSPALAPVDRRDGVHSDISASAYIGELAETSRQRAMSSGVCHNRPRSQDYAPTTNIPMSEEWTPTEQALLRSLPKELATFVINQHRIGIPMREALQTIERKVLEEEGEDTRKAREKEARDRVRSWHSTIHYPPSDTAAHSDTVTSITSTESTHSSTHNIRTEEHPGYHHTPSQETLMTKPQHCGMVGLSEQTSGGNSQETLLRNPEDRQQLGQEGPNQIQKIKSRIQLFYNPPPSVTPLLEADIPAPGKPSETGYSQPQVYSANSPENSDSAIDLRTPQSTERSQLAHEGAAYIESQPMYSPYSLSNSHLYHKAYTAGEPGPIRASSLVNLSSQAMLSSTTPIMYHNLSPTQLLIRNKLLERRSRIQSRSISTPDILHGYEYPNKRKWKRVVESSAGPDKVLPPENLPPPQFHVKNKRREIEPSGTAPSSAIKAIGNVGNTVQRETYCEDIVYDLTIADSRESLLESNTSVQYPKMKSSLKSRWVTESIQSPAVSSIVHNQTERQTPANVGHFVADKELNEVQSPKDQGNQSMSTTSHPVEQVTCSEVSNPPDSNAVKTSGIRAENAADTAAQPVPKRKAGRPKGTIDQSNKRNKANEVSTSHYFSCQFCSFQSFVHSDVRSHIKRDHFAKFQKKDVGASRRGKLEKLGNAAAKTGNTDIAASLPMSSCGVPSNNNNHTTKVMSGATKILDEETSTSKGQGASLLGIEGSVNDVVIVELSPQVRHTEGFVPQLQGVQSHPPITLVHTEITPSTIPVQPKITAAVAPHMHIERLRDETCAVETTSFHHPVMTIDCPTKTPPNATQLVEEQFHCSHCKLRCKNSKELLIHVKFQHTNTKGLNMCFNCGYTAKTKYGLRKHILKWHTQSDKTDLMYKCTQTKCSESFMSNEELHRHTILHDAKRKYVCELCGAKYQHITGLRHHQYRHKLNYPHQCNKCGLKFKTVGVLQRHILQKNHFSS